MHTFDIVILGGGPGGMAAAMALRQAGRSVVLVQDEADAIGGVCLNRGCMPTKSLLKAARVYREAKDGGRYGLDLTAGRVDLQRVRAVTEGDLNTLRTMTGQFMDSAGVTVLRGRGAFVSDHEIRVTRKDGRRT